LNPVQQQKLPTIFPNFSVLTKQIKAETTYINPFQIAGQHRKMNSAAETKMPTNPLEPLRKGLLMSSAASPVTSDYINNS